MARKFIINSPGRTGSHLVAEYLRRRSSSGIRFTHSSEQTDLSAFASQDSDQITVIHDHGQWLPERGQIPQFHFIASDRRSVFDWALSRLCARYTRQYTHYDPATDLQGFRPEIEQLAAEWPLLRERRRQWQVWQRLPWGGWVHVYREDLPRLEPEPRSAILDHALGRSRGSRPLSEPQPWSYPDIVADYEALRAEFYHRCPDAVTP